jgi:MarR family transcriptional regulator, organic hydroperoxide resistance regulator
MDDLDRWATGRMLSAAARLVEHEWNTHLAQWDLNHASLAALHVLLGGPLTQRELATAVQVEDQTVSRTVERLERSGYVERRRDPTDRRRIVVTLTGSGRATCLRAGDVTVAESFFDGGVDDVQALRASLTQIIRHLSSQRWPTSGCAAEVPKPDSPGAADDRDVR